MVKRLLPFALALEIVTLAWDPNPPSEQVYLYNVYTLSTNGSYTFLTSSTNAFASFNVVGAGAVAVSAINARGEGLKSTNFYFLALPSQPKNLRLQ